ncbi:MAG: DUF1659 domain-containing protein [Bacilli bacterium]
MVTKRPTEFQLVANFQTGMDSNGRVLLLRKRFRYVRPSLTVEAMQSFIDEVEKLQTLPIVSITLVETYQLSKVGE